MWYPVRHVLVPVLCCLTLVSTGIFLLKNGFQCLLQLHTSVLDKWVGRVFLQSNIKGKFIYVLADLVLVLVQEEIMRLGVMKSF